MLLNRMSRRLAIGILVLLIEAPAMAQGIGDMQLFASPDLSPYGSGQQPRIGHFFTFDGLNWAISTPDVTTIGFPDLTRIVFYGPDDDDAVVQSNTLDTSTLRNEYTQGNRIEFGSVGERHGWFLSTYRLHNQSQKIVASDVDMVFFDPEFGRDGNRLLEGIVDQEPDPDDPGDPDDPDDPGGTIDILRNLPLTADDVFIRNSVEHWSVELSGIHRFRPCHNGGNIECFYGVRYLEFDDVFQVDARIQPPAEGEEDDGEPEEGEEAPVIIPFILADSFWATEAENHVVGPQLGARWFKTHDRWTLSTEGRFMAGFNSQNIRQRGTIATEAQPPGDLFEPRLLSPTSFTHARHLQEFTPVVGLRVEAWYQLTRAISLRAGWSGLWMDNVARASNMILYEVPDMGLLPQNNSQDVLLHGWNLGVVVNR